MLSFSRDHWKNSLLTLLLIAVMIAVGVTAGLYISRELGIAVWTRGKTLDPVTLANSTTLNLGEVFPDCLVADSSGAEIDLRTLIAGHKTVIGIVSNGCDACTQFLDAVQANQIVPNGYRFLLLSLEPEFFRENYRYPVLGLAEDFMHRYHVYTSPTVLGIDEAGRMKVICSGFSQLLNPGFMERSI